MKRQSHDGGRVDTALFDRPLLDVLAEHSTRLRGRILDVGCGSRPYRHLAQPGSRWIGVDLPRTWSGRSTANIWGSAETLPIRTATIDAVLSTQVIEHLRHPWDFFAEATRVLRPGGSLIVSAPHAQWLHEEPHDYFRFTKHGMRCLAEDAGLDVKTIVPIGGAIALVAFLIGTHIPMMGQEADSTWVRARTALQRMINWAGARLDNAFYSPSDTLGNVLIAERPR